MLDTSAQDVITKLGLERHDEGGWFAETYCASDQVACSDRKGEMRPTMTVIHYLVERSSPRCLLHRNRSDIVHLHLGGGLLRYWTLGDSELTDHHLGPGHLTQLTVPGGDWKATELVDGEWALIAEAVSPGFDYRDRDIADADCIETNHPAHLGTLARFLPVR